MAYRITRMTIPLIVGFKAAPSTGSSHHAKTLVAQGMNTHVRRATLTTLLNQVVSPGLSPSPSTAGPKKRVNSMTMGNSTRRTIIAVFQSGVT